MTLLLLLLLFGDDLADQLPKIKRVFVDRLTGGETAAQMRDLLITALQNSKLFVVTENQDRADAFLRGAAEDLIYTDQFKSSENVSMRGNSSDSESVSSDSRYNGASGGNSSRSARSNGSSIGGGESSAVQSVRRHFIRRCQSTPPKCPLSRDEPLCLSDRHGEGFRMPAVTDRA